MSPEFSRDQKNEVHDALLRVRAEDRDYYEVKADIDKIRDTVGVDVFEYMYSTVLNETQNGSPLERAMSRYSREYQKS